MKTIRNYAAQGDILIIRCAEIPVGAKVQQREGGRIIVTHSETGHHHVIERPRVDMYQGEDPMVAWLEVHDAEELPQVAELVHLRDHDTHETIGLPPGKYQVRRQREYTPEGWRQVMD
jgi:hypothetical protein